MELRQVVDSFPDTLSGHRVQFAALRESVISGKLAVKYQVSPFENRTTCVVGEIRSSNRVAWPGLFGGGNS